MGLERMGTHSESCYKWHLECAVSRYEALRAERDALLSEVTDLRVEAAGVDRLTRETDEVAAAIGGTDYMDPPDGGAPSLGEQVSRMRADRDALRARVAEESARLDYLEAWLQSGARKGYRWSSIDFDTDKSLRLQIDQRIAAEKDARDARSAATGLPSNEGDSRNG